MHERRRMDTYIWTSSVGGLAPPIGLFHKPCKAGADLHSFPRGTLPSYDQLRAWWSVGAQYMLDE